MQIQEEVKKKSFAAENSEEVIEGKLFNENGNFQLKTATEIYRLINDESNCLFIKLGQG